MDPSRTWPVAPRTPSAGGPDRSTAAVGSSARRLALALCFAFAAGPTFAHVGDSPAASTTSVEGRQGEDLRESFGKALDAYRAGDDGRLAEARGFAQRIAETFDRDDVPRYVEHYAALDRESRVDGRELELEVARTRERIFDAFEARMAGEEWNALRIELESSMDDLCARTERHADLVARAQAFALRAEYAERRLTLSDLSRKLPVEQRETMCAQIAEDARIAVAAFEAFDAMRGAMLPRLTLGRIEEFRGRLEPAGAAYAALERSARRLRDDEKLRDSLLGGFAIAASRGDEPESDRCLTELVRLSDARADWDLTRALAMREIHRDRAREALHLLDAFGKGGSANGGDRDNEADAREQAYVRALAHLRLHQFDAARAAAAEAGDGRDGDAAPFHQRYLEARIALAGGDANAAVARLGDPRLLSTLDAREEGAARALLGEARLARGEAREATVDLIRGLERAREELRRALNDPAIEPKAQQTINLIGEWEGAGLETVALLARAQLALGDGVGAFLSIENWQSRSLRGDDDERARLRARSGAPPADSDLSREDLGAWAAASDLGLVSWVFGADSGAVIHVWRDRDGELVGEGTPLSIGREALRDAVAQLRQRAIAGADVGALTAEIRAALMPPSVSRLAAELGSQPGAAPSLMLLAHGPLEGLPFELLDLDSATTLRILPGLPSARPGELDVSKLREWRLLGSPLADLSGDVRLLPGADAELAALRGRHPQAECNAGARFERSAFERALRSNDCVHIATHLETKAHEARSRFPAIGLRLSGTDVVSALEIANLSPASPLVVLSACETGGGRYVDGEGLLGVGRAFLEGGTRNLVVTLWPVEDGAAAQFAERFHAALASGLKPSAAARAARTELRRAGHATADWAAFRFLGRD